MTSDQADFTRAILDPTRAVPDGLRDATGKVAGKRFDVYRNNVAVSLSDALEAAFPAIKSLVGAEFFRAMSGVYLRQYPPTSPMMMFYGQDMPDFLAGFEPAKSLPYLPDIAYLELAQRRSYHAADSTQADASQLESRAPDALLQTRFEFAPSCITVSSAQHPIFDLYRHATQENAPQIGQTPQSVLITRPEYDPILSPMDPATTSFLAQLRLGNPLDTALTSAGEGFDLTPILGTLIAGNAITHIH